ncbi:hypothetical protein Bhyg_01248, partial [Pseudolycoriella hygida]
AVTVNAADNQNQCALLSDDGLEPRQNSCVLSPETVEGPYHIDKLLERSDVTDGEQGIPLDLTFLIRDSKTCELLPNVIVDIWQCNSTGFYSGFVSEGNGYRSKRGIPTDESRFLRGVQTTNANGEVKFRTIYPGWYINRAVHIHIKLYYGMDTTTAKYTGQLYFNEDINEAVSDVLPYSTLKAYRTLNSADLYYTTDQGTRTTLQLTGSVMTGFNATTFVIGIERQESKRGIPTDESRFLRGVQTTNANGEVKFRTIYPGWYVNRAVHIHIKLYYGMDKTTAKYTGQLYFNEDTNKAVSDVLPYSTLKPYRTPNNADEYYTTDQGTRTTLQLTGSVMTGFNATTYVIGIERPESKRGIPTDESRFLRGIQITNANGEVKFRTIYPGWYANRAVHIHIKLYYGMDTTTAKYTGQLYFNEDVNEAVSDVLPYSTLKAYRTLNSADLYYTTDQGTRTTLLLTGSVMTGFIATTFVIGIERQEFEPQTWTYETGMLIHQLFNTTNRMNELNVQDNRDESRFLRGIQTTNANGEVKFRTIYPGWYVNRAVHIHIKLYYGMDTTTAKYTGQLYFNEDINEAVSDVLPYSTLKAYRTLNSVDQYYTTNQGTQTTLQVTGNVMTGFNATTFVIGIERPEASGSASSVFNLQQLFCVLALHVSLIYHSF